MSDDIKFKMISFKKEYHAEYEFLIRQGNASRLVCELVRQYRLSGGGEIVAINVQTNVPTTTNHIKDKKYDNDILDSIKDLID